MNKKQLVTTCVSITEEEIDNHQDMISFAQEVTFGTFFKYVSLKDICMEFGYKYGTHNKDGLLLKDDWSVRYYKSNWKGKLCYYMQHSHIEYIFQ